MQLQPPGPAISQRSGIQPPATFNVADWLLDARVREGRGEAVAIRGDAGTFSYADLLSAANRMGRLLLEEGVQPEQRVIVALHDGIEYAAALLGMLKIGAVAVMVNPHLRSDEIAYFLEHTRAVAALVQHETRAVFEDAAPAARHLRSLLVLGESEGETERRIASMPETLEAFPTHRDDPAIWLFSGGTSGRPKGVVQTHRGYANAAVRYGQQVLGLGPDDVTVSVPKLYFGYAMGANLFFPLSVGASCVLFPDRCTPEAIFEQIRRHRPTVLVNVPTMVQQMVSHPDAARQDLSCLRVATSAGEALPEELYRRWKETFGVELLDGLGTAEMWHIFISNRIGDVRPGTLGRAVPGYEVRVRDEDGRDVEPGDVGFLWVRGDSRALGYWQNMEATKLAFRGEWYVSEDMLSMDEDGYVTYRGRADDMLKVSGKWLSPQEVENRLLQHASVREVAVVGVTDEAGLVVPWAWVVPADGAETGEALAAGLRDFVCAALPSYKAPREVRFLDELPRTHLGKVDRGALRAG